MTPEEIVKFIKDEGVEIIDLKFTDMPGTLQHVGVPPSEVNEELFEKGTGFDGSSIRGFQTIDESDMLLVPDASTATIDPVYSKKTLSLICDIRDPLTSGDYSRDPRHIAHKAEAYLTSTGIGDTSYWGPRGGVLHLRRRQLRAGRPFRALQHRLGRGNLELRQRLPAGRRGPSARASDHATRRATSRRLRWTR